MKLTTRKSKEFNSGGKLSFLAPKWWIGLVVRLARWKSGVRSPVQKCLEAFTIISLLQELLQKLLSVPFFDFCLNRMERNNALNLCYLYFLKDSQQIWQQPYSRFSLRTVIKNSVYIPSIQSHFKIWYLTIWFIIKTL